MNNELDHPTQINCSGAHIYNNYVIKFTGNLHIKQEFKLLHKMNNNIWFNYKN